MAKATTMARIVRHAIVPAFDRPPSDGISVDKGGGKSEEAAGVVLQDDGGVRGSVKGDLAELG